MNREAPTRTNLDRMKRSLSLMVSALIFSAGSVAAQIPDEFKNHEVHSTSSPTRSR